MPSKWTPKWTGPHLVIKRIGAQHRSIIAHAVKHGIEVEVHVNKLCLFNAWSTRTPSTSWELDAARPFVTGTWATKGANVIVPLEAPWPCGAGKVIKAHADGRLEIQWLGNGTTKIHIFGPRIGQDTVLRGHPATQRARVVPYCLADDAAGVAFHQHDVILHGFDLTAEDRKLPAVILQALAAHQEFRGNLNLNS